MKITAIALGIVIVALLGALIFVPSAKTPSTPALSADGRVSVTRPVALDAIASPLAIAGTVTGGGWFFEGTFPVKILDGDGKEIGHGVAAATPPEAWMSTGTVTFSASISFIGPTYSSGTVLLEKDNPSGAPENAGEFRIPVRFARPAVTAGAAGTDATVRGTVTLGPVCAVQPADPANTSCEPQPYQTTVVVRKNDPSEAVFKIVSTDIAGSFSVSLPSGTYLFEPKGGTPYPACNPVPLGVRAGESATVSLHCDTGLR